MHSIKDIVKQLIGKSLDAYNKKYTSPINNRIDNIVAQAGTDNTEIVDARIDSAGVSHTTLNNRILAETKMTDENLIEYSGSSLSVDDTMPGYLQNIEIKGNTIQNEDNLEDIRSVGNKIEGQELYEIPVLSRGKNLFDGTTSATDRRISTSNGFIYPQSNYSITRYIKIKPNTSYCISTGEESYYSFYDINYKYITGGGVRNYKIQSPTNAYYLRFDFATVNKDKVQLEEGTQATPYEPYVEDKLTILSPVQLEKVGDVADRIICKDGVWGVEKNIITTLLSSDLTWYVSSNKLGIKYFYTQNLFGLGISNRQILCDTLFVNNGANQESLEGYNQILAHKSATYSDRIYVAINVEDIASFKSWLKDNPTNIKYVTETQPTFIPLPHSQQVKLRTFANKTNISFLTEVEGTIKAQVPKSLGATVNTHTEQINGLNKELDRVKKLEESTVSTVTTESDFTTVEATSNGYFEDVKLEGKTLVNTVTTYDVSRFSLRNATKQDDGYFKLQYGTTVNDTNVIPRYGVHLYKPNTTYTIVVDIKENTTGTFLGISAINSCIDSTTISKRDFDNLTGISTITFKTRDDITISDKGVLPTYDLYFGIWKDGGDLSKHITFKYWVLEGDHTQNPPSYFEGLKSVGEDIDEIVVSSVNENLFSFDKNKPIDLIEGYCQSIPVYSNGRVYFKGSSYSADNPSSFRNGYINVNCGNFAFESNTSYKVSVKLDIVNNPLNTNMIFAFPRATNQCNLKLNPKTNRYEGVVPSTQYSTNESIKSRIEFRMAGIEGYISEIMIQKYDAESTTYIPHQSDKKRLLFYNNETQTWEKPILREWDSIEKHADGKYYYHQRSGEVVLNGSEDWVLNAGWSGEEMSTNSYYLTADKQKTAGLMVKSFGATNIISEVIPTVFINGASFDSDCISGEKYSGAIYIRINKSKVSNGIKSYLQQNPMRVVYHLAEEKVYECTSIDLITYANETNYIVESGVISPKTTLKVHNNISNVVSLLQKKVSLLESNMTKYMITQNRMQLASTYSADSVTFKVDYALCSEEVEYNEDLYNLILNNILVGKDNYDYNKMFNIILDYASWNQISWEQFDILVGVMDSQHNPPIEEEIPVE